MATDQLISLGSLAEKVRKTGENPPRIAVVDVIAAVKGCDVHYAAQLLRRMISAGVAPDVEQVQHEVVENTVRNNASELQHGGNRKPVIVATAEEIVQILWALPGSSDFRIHSAKVVVRFLGGDPTLAQEIFANHEAQRRLSQESPTHPARMFGEAVEGNDLSADGAGCNVSMDCFLMARKRFLDDVREAVRSEMQQQHVWSFSKRSRNHRHLMETGRIVNGSALRELDTTEHLVRVVDFLKDRIDCTAWMLHGRKFKNIYAVELKSAKLRECIEEGLPPYVTFNQGEYRIVYTEADTDLMVQVLAACQHRFENIAERDAPIFRKPRRGQRSIVEFMQPRPQSEAEEDSGSDGHIEL